MYRHYTILNHLIHHPMNQKQACICQAHCHGMPVLSFPLIQARAIYLQMNYHPLHHLGRRCNHHQILITKFLVSTFFAIFYFTSFLQVHISVFSDDIDILRHSLSLHGIPSFNLTLNDCRYALIYHIFEGFCYNFKLDISGASHHPD